MNCCVLLSPQKRENIFQILNNIDIGVKKYADKILKKQSASGIRMST